MEWQVILALVFAVPIILLPVVYVWYLNIGSLREIIRERRAKRVAEKKSRVALNREESHIV